VKIYIKNMVGNTYSTVVGFITPWPYNYWRLQKHGK